MSAPIFFASVLLEPNRWTPEKLPSLRVSDWTDRLSQVGWDGIELWESHAALTGKDEVARLANALCPVRIFNTYADLESEDTGLRERAIAFCRRFKTDGMKFNFPPPGSSRSTALRRLGQWMERLPAGFRMLCECHAGSLAEDPEAARDLFREIGDPRLQAVVHPLERKDDALSRDRLNRWFDALGERITHTHLQTRGGRNPAQIREAFEILRRREFRGTHTLECTVGTGQPGESPDTLWVEAMRDFSLIRELAAERSSSPARAEAL